MIQRDKGKKFKPLSLDQQEEMGKLYISIFSDASHCPRTHAWGYGFWIKYGFPATTILDGGGGKGEFKSSNEVETHGIRKALERLKSHVDFKDKIVVVSCDNLHSCNEVREDVDELVKLGAQRAYVKHVKGHKGKQQPKYAVNTKCDRIAGDYMRKYRGD